MNRAAAPTWVFLTTGFLFALLGACQYDSAAEGSNIGGAEGAGVEGSTGGAEVDADAPASVATKRRVSAPIITKILPSSVQTLTQPERACGMRRKDERSEASPVYLNAGAAPQAQKRAVECLRVANSRYFSGEAVNLAVNLLEREPCVAVNLIDAAMQSDLSTSRVSRGAAERWSASNVARFTRVRAEQLEGLARHSPSCFPASDRAEGARSALAETARRLRSGNLTDIKIGNEQ